MVKRRHHGGGRFEKAASYARAVRVGPFVWVAGTTAVEPSGQLHAPGDAYAQTQYALRRIRLALNQVGAEMHHVVRTTAFLRCLKTDAAGFVRAHGEVFAGIEPVMSAVEAGLATPGMTVEILVDAVIHDESGKIDLP
ncbi:MAG: Rid family hydrolase [Pararhodobacter sp.]